MRRSALWLMVGLICLGTAVVPHARQAGGTAEKPSPQLSDETCQALEQFIARIDSARSVEAKEKRQERYREAQEKLAAGVKGPENAVLLAQTAEYVQYTEQVVSIDPTDPKLPDLLEKRLNLRGAILDKCDHFTASR